MNIKNIKTHNIVKHNNHMDIPMPKNPEQKEQEQKI